MNIPDNFWKQNDEVKRKFTMYIIGNYFSVSTQSSKIYLHTHAWAISGRVFPGY